MHHAAVATHNLGSHREQQQEKNKNAHVKVLRPRTRSVPSIVTAHMWADLPVPPKLARRGGRTRSGDPPFKPRDNLASWLPPPKTPANSSSATSTERPSPSPSIAIE